MGISASAFASTYTFTAASASPAINGNSNTATLINNGLALTLNGWTATNSVPSNLASGWTTGTATADDFITEDVSGTSGPADIGLDNSTHNGVVCVGICAYNYVSFGTSAFTNMSSLTLNLADSLPSTAVEWAIWGSSATSGSLTEIAYGWMGGSYPSAVASYTLSNTVLNTYKDIEISGGDCTVLITSITTGTPEPSTFAFFVVPVLGLASRKLYQRFAKKQA